MPSSFGTTERLFAGFAVDRSVFRKTLPDARWLVYAAGWLNPGDGNTATVRLAYEKDDGTLATLATLAQVGGGRLKAKLGPADLFGSAGVPAGETIAMIRLGAVKNTGVNGTVENWTIWVRFLAPKQ